MSLDTHISMEKSANRGNAVTLLEAKERIQGAYPNSFIAMELVGFLKPKWNSSKRQTLEVGLELNSISYIEN